MARIPYADSNGQLSVEVELKHAADVYLVDESNYRKMNSGSKYKYFVRGSDYSYRFY